MGALTNLPKITQYAKTLLDDADAAAARATLDALVNAGRTDWAGSGVENAVIGMMLWRNYGNGHIIFDASAGVDPAGVAISNANPGVEWASTYPTLMGWNGLDNFGVRVDACRRADSAASADSATTATTANNLAAQTTGAVGTYALLSNTSGVITPGTDYAGSSLQYSGITGVGNIAAGSAPAGTWRAMGAAGGTVDAGMTLFQRVA